MPISSDKVTVLTFLHANQPDRPNTVFPSSADFKVALDTQAQQLQTGHNNLIDHLLATTSGDSGAHNIGSAAVSGLTGSTVFAQLSSASTNIQNTLVPATASMLGRNLLINSGFDIWQRGTSFSIPGNGQYTADRWFSRRQNSSLGATVSRQTGENARYCIRLQRNEGDTNTDKIWASQITETVNTIPFRGKVLTVSFRARKGDTYSQPNSRMSLFLKTGTDVDGTHVDSGGGINGSTIIAANSFVLTTSFQTFSITATVNVPSNANIIQTLFETRALGQSFSGTAGANDYIEVEQLQVTEGSTVLPYAARQISDELNLCKRYYQNIVSDATVTNAFIGGGTATSTTNGRISIELENEMRILPTVSATASDYILNDGVTSTDVTATTKLTTQSSSKKVVIDCTVAAGLTQFRPYSLLTDGTAVRIFALDAEL